MRVSVLENQNLAGGSVSIISRQKNGRWSGCPLHDAVITVRAAAVPAAVTQRRFPPPWSVEDIGAAFVVKRQ
jgi:hypothetical protein